MNKTKCKYISKRVTKKEYEQILQHSKPYGSITLYLEYLLKKDGIDIISRTNKHKS